MAAPSSDPPTLFQSRAPEPERSSPLPWIVAAAAVLLVGVIVFFSTRTKPVPAGQVEPPAGYAAQLPIAPGSIQMSESSSLSGAKVTYIDGTVQNTGRETVTAATAQVLFRNDEQLPPQVETTSLTLIRTHEPYIDIEQIAAAPIRPGESREFRLVFENIDTNWNGSIPEIRLTAITTR